MDNGAMCERLLQVKSEFRAVGGSRAPTALLELEAIDRQAHPRERLIVNRENFVNQHHG